MDKEIFENEFKKELDIILKIVLQAKSSFDIVKVLNDDNHKNSTTINHEKLHNRFFTLVEVNFFRITIIELYKLFHPTEIYSFNKLRARFNERYPSFRKDEIFKELKAGTKELKSLIIKLKELRSKFYAHQDEDFKNYINHLDLEEIGKLIQKSEKLFNIIYKGYYNEEYDFNFQLGTPLDDFEATIEKCEYFNNHFE